MDESERYTEGIKDLALLLIDQGQYRERLEFLRAWYNGLSWFGNFESDLYFLVRRLEDIAEKENDIVISGNGELLSGD